MEPRKDSANTAPETIGTGAGKFLDIAIIGAGIAGLSTALAISRASPSQHRITVYEAHPSLSELGTGIQLFSNATRILHELGLEDEFRRVVNQPGIMELRRYEDDSIIGGLPQNPQNEWEYGSPHWQIYRPDFERLLTAACEERKDISLVFNTRVQSISLDTYTITFSSQPSATFDLLIAADGLRSKLRSSIPANASVSAQAFDEYCFRATVPKERMLQHPSTAELMKTGDRNLIWSGPGACVLGYPIAAGELYNIVLSVPHPAEENTLGNWSQKGDLSEGAKLLSSFCPRVQTLWSLVSECNKWQLGHLPPLPTFISPSGNLVIVGDAAHAILPHSGQGAAMALEDAVTLATCLAHLTRKSDLQRLMATYNTLRQDRMAFIRRYAAANQQFLQMPDGPAQEKRDGMFATMTAAWKKEYAELGEEGVRAKKEEQRRNLVGIVAGGAGEGEEDLRSPETRMRVFGYDAREETRRALKQAGF